MKLVDILNHNVFRKTFNHAVKNINGDIELHFYIGEFKQADGCFFFPITNTIHSSDFATIILHR